MAKTPFQTGPSAPPSLAKALSIRAPDILIVGNPHRSAHLHGKRSQGVDDGACPSSANASNLPNIFCSGCVACACPMNSDPPILRAISLAGWRLRYTAEG